MVLLWKLIILLPFMSCSTGEESLHGPIFIQEPHDITYSMGSANPEILLNCTAKGYPLPYYRWKQNGTDIDLTMSYHYRLVGGSLAINNPHKKQDTGTYQCLATNSFGTILSRKAKLQFACIGNSIKPCIVFKHTAQEKNGKCILPFLAGRMGNRRQQHERVRGAGEGNYDQGDVHRSAIRV